jgi:hypothetical protein
MMMADRKSLQINSGQASLLLQYGICQRCIEEKSCGKDPAGPEPEMEVQCLNHGLLVPHFLNVRNSRLKYVVVHFLL